MRKRIPQANGPPKIAATQIGARIGIATINPSKPTYDPAFMPPKAPVANSIGAKVAMSVIMPTIRLALPYPLILLAGLLLFCCAALLDGCCSDGSGEAGAAGVAEG